MTDAGIDDLKMEDGDDVINLTGVGFNDAGTTHLDEDFSRLEIFGLSDRSLFNFYWTAYENEQK